MKDQARASLSEPERLEAHRPIYFDTPPGLGNSGLMAQMGADAYSHGSSMGFANEGRDEHVGHELSHLVQNGMGKPEPAPIEENARDPKPGGPLQA